jgi:hypothetical protein
MAHFAEIDDSGNVISVIVVSNDKMLVDGIESEQKGIDFCNSIFGGGKWIQTSYNNNFRYNFASIGFTYDSEKDAFIPPKPSDKYALDTNNFQWILIENEQEEMNDDT